MAGSSTAAPEVAGEVARETRVGAPSRAWRKPGRVILFGVILLGLIGVLVAAAVREATTRSGPATPAGVGPGLGVTRPPFTAAEEAYARALWSIHGEVKTSAIRMTFGGISYKTREIGRGELKARVDASADVYRRAEARVRRLQPPPSLRSIHADYLDALRLYRQSAAEMVRVSNDGRDDHLVAAFPMSREAARKLLEVGNTLWPGEYVPN